MSVVTSKQIKAMNAVKYQRRYYIEQYGYIWSFSLVDYKRFLEHAATCKDGWNLDDPQWNARQVKRPPTWARPIHTVDWSNQDFANEIEYLDRTGKQTGIAVDPRSFRLTDE